MSSWISLKVKVIRLRFGFSIGPTLFWILKFGQTLSAVPFTYITTVHHPSADGSLFWDRTNFIVSISLAWHWLYWFWSSDSCLCETCFSFDLTNQQQYLFAGYILISICPDHWLGCSFGATKARRALSPKRWHLDRREEKKKQAHKLSYTKTSKQG